jgi:hypothetical protein
MIGAGGMRHEGLGCWQECQRTQGQCAWYDVYLVLLYLVLLYLAAHTRAMCWVRFICLWMCICICMCVCVYALHDDDLQHTLCGEVKDLDTFLKLKII